MDKIAQKKSGGVHMEKERKRILEMVEKGVISTTEALTLLEALEKETHNQENEGDKKEESTAKTNSTKDDFYTQVTNTGEKILDFVNTTMSKLKDLDIMGYPEQASHVFQHANANISIVEIDVANGKVELKPWDQKDVRIEVDGKLYQFDQKEATSKTILDKTNFSIKNGKLHFSTTSKMLKIDSVIYLPEQLYDYVSVRIFNGTFSGDKIAAKELMIKTVNGDINIKNVKGDEGVFETANGHIKVDNGKLEKVEAETVNGNIKLKGSVQTVEFQTFNGDIHYVSKDEKVAQLHLKTVTGSIDMKLPKDIGVSGELKTNLGSFKLNLEGIDILEEKSEVVQKHLHFKRRGKNDTSVYAETKTGTISMKEYD